MEKTESMNLFNNFTLLFVRIAVALVFLFAGWAKLSFWNSPPSGFSPSMLLLIKFLSIVEPLGALALLLGYLTRWAAAGLLVIMIGAIFVLIFTMGTGFFTTPQGLGWDYNLLLLANCLILLAYGAGNWSLDRLRMRNDF